MIDVCVIGYGRAGEAHARCYDDPARSRIVAVVDPTPARRDAARARFPRAVVASALEHLEVDVDLALICTPPTSHERYIEQALMRGAHVFCEKPAFLDPDTGVRLIALARQRDRLIHPGHNYLYSPQLRRLRESASPDRIGAVQRIDMRIERPAAADGSADWIPSWRRDPELSGGGILIDHGPHCIYLTEWLAGSRIHRVGCTMDYASDGVEDHVELVLGTTGGVEAHIVLSWRAPHRRTVYRITGAHGAVVLDGGTLTADGPAGRRTWRLAETPGTRHAHDDWLPDLAAEVLRRLTCATVDPEPARSALVVAETIAAARASAADGGLPHPLPPRTPQRGNLLGAAGFSRPSR